MNNEDWEKAGKIAGQVREYSKNLIKIDASLLEVTEKIEKKIFDLGGKPAFPVDLSINEVAAHYSALCDDSTIFKEKDIIKIDIGVSINGAIGDTACTVSLNGDKNLIKASELALKEAIRLVRPGVKLFEIGQVIQDKIQEFGFSPIRNLSGHGLGLFQIHAKPSIPNYNNGNETTLGEDQIIAIEPFATTGSGLVMEGKPSQIYMLVNKKPVRDFFSRKLLIFIESNYNKLPFAKRWLPKEFDKLKLEVSLNQLERGGILKQFPQLPEKSNGLVSQTEHTILVKDKPKILTE